MIRTGIDIVVTARVERLSKEEAFMERVFTDGERSYASGRRRPARHLAGRFAAKEACMKALGTGWGEGVEWKDVEVTSGPGGRPVLKLHSKAEEIARGGAAHLSIAYAGEVAVATVLIESRQESRQQLRQESR